MILGNLEELKKSTIKDRKIYCIYFAELYMRPFVCLP